MKIETGGTLNFTDGDFNPNHSIVVGGVLVDIGVPTCKWYDNGGFDGYIKDRIEFSEEDRRTGRIIKKVIKGPRFGRRKGVIQSLIGGRFSGLDTIRQFFIHHSGGDGKDPTNMYNTLYKRRKLSVQHALEDDGRLFQFNDVADLCWHAGSHNRISTGVECCLYPLAGKNPDYYSEKRRRKTGNLPHNVVIDEIHGQKMRVFAFTEPQIESLASLAAGVWCALFHLVNGRVGSYRGISLDDYFAGPPLFPKEEGRIPRTVYSDAINHVGMIGHLQCTKRKIDPAGFPWERFENMVTSKYYEFRSNVR